MPTSTTKAKTLTPASVEKAMTDAMEKIAQEMSGTQFADAVMLIGKLMIKYVKEEISK